MNENASMKKNQQELEIQKLVLESIIDDLNGSKTYTNEEVFVEITKMLSNAKNQ